MLINIICIIYLYKISLLLVLSYLFPSNYSVKCLTNLLLNTSNNIPHNCAKVSTQFPANILYLYVLICDPCDYYSFYKSLQRDEANPVKHQQCCIITAVIWMLISYNFSYCHGTFMMDVYPLHTEWLSKMTVHPECIKFNLVTLMQFSREYFIKSASWYQILFVTEKKFCKIFH